MATGLWPLYRGLQAARFQTDQQSLAGRLPATKGAAIHLSRMDEGTDEVIVEIGRQKVRLTADSMEEDIDAFFNGVIQELILPLMQEAVEKGRPGPLIGERFWDEVFARIAEMVNDLSAAERKLILRAVVSVEAYRRFQEILQEERQSSRG